MQSLACINSLYRLAHNCAQVDFHHKAFSIIQQAIEFDSAGWGESSEGINKIIDTQNETSKNLIRLLDDYNRLSFSSQITNNREDNTIYMVNLNLDCDDPGCCPELNTWGRTHKIRNVLHTISYDENRFQAYTVTLWRSNPNSGFTDCDLRRNKIIVPHLVESFRLCRRLNFQMQLKVPKRISHAHAICTQQGCLLDIDEIFIDILKTDYPRWDGKYLPDEFIGAFNDNSHYMLKKYFYHWNAVDDKLLICAMLPDRVRVLSNRELQVAYSYSRGRPYKVIAKHLAIAPVTVRNHISNIYRKLDINNKTMLMQLFE